MEVKELILKKIEKIPEEKLVEILDFIHSLESGISEDNIGMAIISESALNKDWLKAEEDEAWKNL